MPRRITNPSKHPDSLTRGLTPASYPDFKEVPEWESCDLCATTRALYEQTVDGERVVACVYCLKTAGVSLIEWKRVGPPQPKATPVDVRSMKRIGGRRVLPLSHRTLASGVRRCLYPGCGRILKKWQVACPEHWELIPHKLQKDFLRSSRTPQRRAMYQRVERYLAMRAQFRKKAV